MHSANEKRVGHGHVRLTFDECRTITTHEKGTWQQGATFSNSFRFNFTKHVITLEHLRFGSSHPVFLCELIEKKAGLLISKAPHVCGQDRYQVDVKFGSQRVHLIWDVKGPYKAYQLHYTYC